MRLGLLDGPVRMLRNRLGVGFVGQREHYVARTESRSAARAPLLPTRPEEAAKFRSANANGLSALAASKKRKAASTPCGGGGFWFPQRQTLPTGCARDPSQHPPPGPPRTPLSPRPSPRSVRTDSPDSAPHCQLAVNKERENPRPPLEKRQRCARIFPPRRATREGESRGSSATSSCALGRGDQLARGTTPDNRLHPSRFAWTAGQLSRSRKDLPSVRGLRRGKNVECQ